MVHFGGFASDARDPLSGDRRHIFLLEKGKALVVKFIAGTGRASMSAYALASEQVKEASVQVQVAAAKHEM